MKKLLFITFICTTVITIFSINSCKSTQQTNSNKESIENSNSIMQKETVNDEFARSTSNLNETISIDTFKADKAAILKIISELAIIMNRNDFEKWKKYLTKESMTYWSNPTNLANVSKKLRGYTLKSLEDYFRILFIPARKGHEVTEIRYISETYVKAVQVQENQDIIYYSFNKINGKWLLKLEK